MLIENNAIKLKIRINFCWYILSNKGISFQELGKTNLSHERSTLKIVRYFQRIHYSREARKFKNNQSN